MATRSELAWKPTRLFQCIVLRYIRAFMENMNKNLFCPHCREEIPLLNTGFSFDEDLNMICDKCKKVIFPTTKSAEQQFLPNQSKDQKIEEKQI